MKTIATALGGITLLAATPLSAQDTSDAAELSAEQITAGVRYFMPQMIEVIQDKCAGSLETEGYLAQNGDALLAKFSEGAEDKWPDARKLFIAFGKEGGAESGSMAVLNEIPDEALRPLIDAVLPMEMGKRIKPRDCASVERVMRTLDPLPAENFAEFVGVVFELALKDRGKNKSVKAAVE